jgi:hypothetical protein
MDDGCLTDELDGERERIRRCTNSRHQWSELEAAVVDRVTFLWKAAFERMAAKGWLRLERSKEDTFSSENTDMNPKYASAMDANRLPRIGHATMLAIEEAERVIPGTEQAKGPHSRLGRASPEVKAHAAAVVPYAFREMKDMSGTEAAGTS